MALNIQTTDTDDATEIAVSGTVDLYSAPELRNAVLDAIPGAGNRVSINLSNVDYMDSSGVAVLVEGMRSAREHDSRFALVAPSRQVMKVLELAKLDTMFTIEDA